MTTGSVEVPRDRWGRPKSGPAVSRSVDVPGPKFWSRVDFLSPGGCWKWTGSVDGSGYGQARHDARLMRAHRITYLSLIGPLPEGLVLDHLCRNILCCNPDHLEAVTQAENVRRGHGGKHWREKTHCPRGHSYSGDNLYTNTKGHRFCRKCKSIRAAERRQQLAAKVESEAA